DENLSWSDAVALSESVAVSIVTSGIVVSTSTAVALSESVAVYVGIDAAVVDNVSIQDVPTALISNYCINVRDNVQATDLSRDTLQLVGGGSLDLVGGGSLELLV